MTLIDDPQFEEEELDLAAPETRAAGRWNSAGVPGERSKDFRRAIRRLVRMLGPEAQQADAPQAMMLRHEHADPRLGGLDGFYAARLVKS